MFAFSVHSRHRLWGGENNWNPFLMEDHVICHTLPYMIITMAASDLLTQGAMASVSMVLMQFSWNIPFYHGCHKGDYFSASVSLFTKEDEFNWFWFGTWIDEVMDLRWFSTSEFALTHWVNYNVIAADNGLSPVQRQTISWTNDGLFPNQTLRDMFQWNFIWNSNLFVYENAYENVICKNGGQLASASMCSRLDQHILWSIGNGRYNLIGDANKHRAKHANNISRRHLIKPAVALLHCSIL